MQNWNNCGNYKDVDKTEAKDVDKKSDWRI